MEEESGGGGGGLTCEPEFVVGMVDDDVVETVEWPAVEIVDQSLRRRSTRINKHESRRTSQISLATEEDLVLVPATSIAVLDVGERVLHDFVVFAVDRVDLHGFAGLVVGSEVVAVGLLDVHARLVGELVVAGFDESQGWFGADYIFECRVVDDESWAFGGEG